MNEVNNGYKTCIVGQLGFPNNAHESRHFQGNPKMFPEKKLFCPYLIFKLGNNSVNQKMLCEMILFYAFQYFEI